MEETHVFGIGTRETCRPPADRKPERIVVGVGWYSPKDQFLLRNGEEVIDAVGSEGEAIVVPGPGLDIEEYRSVYSGIDKAEHTCLIRIGVASYRSGCLVTDHPQAQR